MVNIFVTLISDKFSQKRKEVNKFVDESVGEYIFKRIKFKFQRKVETKKELSIIEKLEVSVDKLIEITKLRREKTDVLEPRLII